MNENGGKTAKKVAGQECYAILRGEKQNIGIQGNPMSGNLAPT